MAPSHDPATSYQLRLPEPFADPSEPLVFPGTRVRKRRGRPMTYFRDLPFAIQREHAINALTAELGRTPSARETYEWLHFSKSHYFRLMKTLKDADIRPQPQLEPRAAPIAVNAS